MKTLKSYLLICVGTFLVALSINMFFVKHHLVFGGVAGLAIVLETIAKLPISATNLLINIPLFLIGAKFIGREFLTKSVFATMILSLFLELTSGLKGFSSDLIVAAIFGGGILGIGVGIVLKSGGSTGGTDMFVMILNKRFNASVGMSIFLTDSCIIALGIFIFGVNHALYALIVVFCISRAAERTIQKFDEIWNRLGHLFHPNPNTFTG